MESPYISASVEIVESVIGYIRIRCCIVSLLNNGHLLKPFVQDKYNTLTFFKS